MPTRSRRDRLAARAAAGLATIATLAAVVPAAAVASHPGRDRCERVVPRAAAVLCLVNVVRQDHGRRPLDRDPRLERAARRHARDMVARRYFEHVSPGGGTLRGRVERTGWMLGRRSWWLGEDLAWGAGRAAAPRAIVLAWMRSPPHRGVLLSDGARVAGVGVADGTPRRAPWRGATYDLDVGT